MKAELWKVEVGTAGVLSISHTWARDQIFEIYIPDHGIAFNTGSGIDLNCFKTSLNRYDNAKKIADIEVPDKMVEDMKTYIEILDPAVEWFNSEVREHRKEMQKEKVEEFKTMQKSMEENGYGSSMGK